MKILKSLIIHRKVEVLKLETPRFAIVEVHAIMKQCLENRRNSKRDPMKGRNAAGAVHRMTLTHVQ
jgi:hypothetical protein